MCIQPLSLGIPATAAAPRGASAHVTQDNFLFNSTLINGALIEILHRTQQCSPASTSSQYRGHLSRWRGQSGECDIGKIITRRGKHSLQQWGCLTGQGDPDCLSFQLWGETEGHLLIVMLFYWLSNPFKKPSHALAFSHCLIKSHLDSNPKRLINTNLAHQLESFQDPFEEPIKTFDFF